MMAIATLALLLAGFAVLALAMPKHYRQLFGPLPSRGCKLTLVVTGWLLLAVSIAPAIIDHGLSVGLVFWFGIATVAALAVAMLLTYRNLWWRV